MKTFFAALFAVILVTAAARADTTNIDMSGTSPAGASATAVGYTTATQLATYTTCSGYAVLTGGTGGTLDVFIQTAFKSVTVAPIWVDVVHFPQITAAAAAAGFAFTMTRFSPSTAAITAGLNTVSATPALPANTIVPGLLGYLVRVVYKTGVGNTAGAAQTILLHCSST